MSNRGKKLVKLGISEPGYLTAKTPVIPTHIQTVTNNAAPQKGIYPLDGRKLNERPTKKGVYIIAARSLLSERSANLLALPSVNELEQRSRSW